MPASFFDLSPGDITEPNEKHTVTPYLMPVSQAVTYPEPEVTVLAMERTYWEKATLIHVECRRKSVKGNAARMSRHWYDLFKMSGELKRYFTVEMYELLDSVVRQKKAFYCIIPPGRWVLRLARICSISFIHQAIL